MPEPGGTGPVRTCVGCRRRCSPNALVRVVAGADGRLAYARHAPGRGAWLCAAPDGAAAAATCLDAAVRRDGFRRVLRRPLVAGCEAPLRSAPGERATLVEGVATAATHGKD